MEQEGGGGEGSRGRRQLANGQLDEVLFTGRQVLVLALGTKS